MRAKNILTTLDNKNICNIIVDPRSYPIGPASQQHICDRHFRFLWVHRCGTGHDWRSNLEKGHQIRRFDFLDRPKYISACLPIYTPAELEHFWISLQYTDTHFIYGPVFRCLAAYSRP